MQRPAVIIFVLTSLVGCATAIPLDEPPTASCAPTKGGQAATPDSGMGPDTESPDTETPDTETPEDTAIADTGTPTGDPCNDCLNAKCSTEVSGCFSEAMCKDLMTCLSACGDDACAYDCFTKYPSPAYERLGTCGEASCSTECFGP